MWTVVYMTQNVTLAKEIETLLANQGILVKSRQLTNLKNSSEHCFEILVPENEVEDSFMIISEKGYVM